MSAENNTFRNFGLTNGLISDKKYLCYKHKWFTLFLN